MGDLSGEILFEKFSIAECFKKDDHTAVYLADHIFLGKKIILKVLNTETIGDDRKIERFKREAKIMAKLEHPNIIKVLDFGMFKNYFYISQEYFKGFNLRRYITSNDFTLEQTRHIFRQFFSALQYAHQNKVIHRDIKPENIFINDNLDVKIGDFGLALSISDNFVTGQFSIVGTPTYMSPEQISGSKLDERSDLFSSGIVMFEMLSGKNPFMGKDINESINNIVNFDGIPETESIKYQEFVPILEKLLKKSPKQRASSAAIILEELGEPADSMIHTGSIPESNKGKSRYFILSSIIVVVLMVSLYFVFLPESEPKKIDDGNNKIIANSVDSLSEVTPPPAEETELEQPDLTEETLTNSEDSAPEPEIILPGTLDIECFPWADVYIDSRKIDTTPLEAPLQLDPGKYKLKLVHPEYPVYESEITISSDKTSGLKVNLETLFGYAVFNIFPWAEVILNDSSYGHTPFNAPLKLIPGEYFLVLKNPAFAERNESIEIQKDDTVTINYNFRKNLE